MSVMQDIVIVGKAINSPACKTAKNESTEEKSWINAKGIHPIRDELLTKKAIDMENVMRIKFLSNLD
jgi:hypothetical protein